MAGGSGAGAPGDARGIAFEILRRVERSGAFASILLQRLPRAVPPREVHLATELVYGCLRFRFRDEHVMGAFAGRPLAEIDPDIALLFRIAAHQILRLTRIPDRAAVSEAVEAARSLPGKGPEAHRRREGGTRFLNALLRRLCRERGSLPLPPAPAAGARPEEAARALSILHSHPEWIVRRFIDRFGIEETAALLEANNAPAPIGVRVDRARATMDQAAASLAAEGVTTEPSAIVPDFLRVLDGAPQRTKTFRQGSIYIQDEASGLIPHLLAPRAGSRVIDACAAPGGKALALARMIGERGIVVAGDLHPARLRLVAANARRMRVGNLRLVAGDFTEPPVGCVFDAALVDAPCSGSGVFRRDVESRYRLAPEDLPALAANQRRILEGVATIVRPGGRLLYAVCSIEPEEGPEVVAGFLEEHGGSARVDPRDRGRFNRVDLREILPEHAGLFASDGSLRTLPHRHGLDGFYAAVMVKE